MPTAGEYDTMAVRFDGRATDLEALPAGFVASLSPQVMVGPLVQAVDQTFQVSARNLMTAATSLRDAGAECRRRAGVCRAYTRAVDSYRRQLADPNIDPSTLSAPYRQPWVRYG